MVVFAKTLLAYGNNIRRENST